MYATLAFAITLLGVFSIFEILKGNQKFSLLKYYILARLIIVTVGSGLDYLGFNGYELPYYKEVFKILALLLTVNLFFLIVQKKIPKLVAWIEVFFILFFIVELIFGLENPSNNMQVMCYRFSNALYNTYLLKLNTLRVRAIRAF